MVSIPACHAGDQGSIPCRGAFDQPILCQIFQLIFQINQEHFEFNVTSEVLLAEVKVCVPWNEIIKMESHFSNDLHALVIHVEVIYRTYLLLCLQSPLSFLLFRVILSRKVMIVSRLTGIMGGRIDSSAEECPLKTDPT